MTTKFPLKMSERAFVCQLTLLNIDTYSNILIESSINTNEMYSRINEKRIYVIDITFSINESIFSGNEQQKVYFKHYRGILVPSPSPNVDSGSGLCRRTYQDASITKQSKDNSLKLRNNFEILFLFIVIITQMFNDSRD